MFCMNENQLACSGQHASSFAVDSDESSPREGTSGFLRSQRERFGFSPKKKKRLCVNNKLNCECSPYIDRYSCWGGSGDSVVLVCARPNNGEIFEQCQTGITEGSTIPQKCRHWHNSKASKYTLRLNLLKELFRSIMYFSKHMHGEKNKTNVR